jgi:hypothetical protein
VLVEAFKPQLDDNERKIQKGNVLTKDFEVVEMPETKQKAILRFKFYTRTFYDFQAQKSFFYKNAIKDFQILRNKSSESQKTHIRLEINATA